MIRVVHTVPALFDDREGVLGGAERYAFELARHMAEVVPTTLLTFGTRDRRERVGRLEVRVLGNPWLVRGQRSNPFKTGIISCVRGADVVHCHQQHVLTSSVVAAYCRLTKRRVFVSDLGGGGWDVSAYLPTDRWFHGHLHLSEYSRRVAGHEGKPWSHVILGGVDAEKFSPGGVAPRDGPVLFVGRLLPHKGVDVLIRAVPADVPLEIIGQPYHEAYAGHLRRLAKGKQVRFRESCDDAALLDAYRGASCVVLPSVYRDMLGGETRVPELLGQTLLEGMACGVPVLCSDVASMPEVVDHGTCGFVVPANDPDALGERLQWLRAHPEEARDMGEAGRRRVLERFAWSRVVERCLEIYGGGSGGN